MRTARIVALAAALSLAAASSASQANGRFPTAQHVVVGPGPSSDVIALRTTFGLLLSRNGGRTFAWMCEEGLYYPLVPAFNYDAPIEVTAGGTVLYAYEEGLRTTFDACKHDEVESVRGRFFADLTTTPAGTVAYAIEGAQSGVNAVFRGDTMTGAFRRVGDGVAGVAFDTIEVAPSDPMRLYLTGRREEGFAPVFFRSDDGGATMRALTGDGGTYDSLWVSGVDPTNPDVVFVRAAAGLGTELLRSRDGGMRFERVAMARDPMLGFAISDDGRTVWYGSIAEGLQRSDDGGETFRQVNPLPVLCLRQHAGTLWACSDWINQPFALGRSSDGGRSFSTVVNFSNFDAFVGPPTCTQRSEGADICVERWPLLQRMLEAPEPDASAPVFDSGARDATADVPRDAARDAAFDAAPDAATPAPPDTTCGCRTPGLPTRSPLVALVALALAALRRRRARR